MTRIKTGIDLPAQIAGFNALLSESLLNNNPAFSPDEHRMGLLAGKFLAAEDGSAEREVIRRQMADLSVKMLDDPVERTWEGGGRQKPGPNWQLAKDLLDASIQRADLGVKPPKVLDAISPKPVPHGPIGERMGEILSRSLIASQAACKAARRGEGVGVPAPVVCSEPVTRVPSLPLPSDHVGAPAGEPDCSGHDRRDRDGGAGLVDDVGKIPWAFDDFDESSGVLF